MIPHHCQPDCVPGNMVCWRRWEIPPVPKIHLLSLRTLCCCNSSCSGSSRSRGNSSCRGRRFSKDWPVFPDILNVKTSRRSNGRTKQQKQKLCQRFTCRSCASSQNTTDTCWAPRAITSGGNAYMTYMFIIGLTVYTNHRNYDNMSPVRRSGQPYLEDTSLLGC